MAICARLPRMSSRHKALSNGIEALISRMIALGPAANLPPHIWLEPEVSRLSITLSATLVLLLAGCDRGAPEPAQGEAASPAPPAAKPLTAGAIDRSHAGEAMPELDLVNPTGKAFDQGDLEGRPVLLNLWATWCAPCVKEMPLLDDLVLEEPKLTVLTASQDMGPPEEVAEFFEKEGLEHLKPWIDREGALGMAFGGGLPVTVLYDARGKEVWRVTGDLDWGAPDVRGALEEGIRSEG